MSSNPEMPQASGIEYPRWSETLRNQRSVLIRPITAQDRDAERAFIEGLSEQARRFRFLGQLGEPSEALLERFTNVDFKHEVAFVAVVAEDAHQHIVGVSRYGTDDAGLHCECAVTVEDEWQDQGLGTLLMRHLIEVARSRGIRTMYSIDSAENTRMRDLAKFLGFHAKADPDDATQVIHELDLQAQPCEAPRRRPRTEGTSK
jgi:GNAT superfamily N-acetyltransferase